MRREGDTVTDLFIQTVSAACFPALCYDLLAHSMLSESCMHATGCSEPVGIGQQMHSVGAVQSI